MINRLSLILIMLWFFIPVNANFKNAYNKNEINHSNFNISFHYFPAKLRKIELSSMDLDLNFPICDFSIGYAYQFKPVFHLGVSFDYFFGNGKNISNVNNYDLETTSGRSGYFVGIFSDFTINLNDFFAITHTPSLKIGKAEDSIVGVANYNNTNTEVLRYYKKDVCVAYVHKLMFDFTFRQRFTVSAGILYQFSKIVNGTLWETNEIGDDWVEHPPDIGKGFGVLIDYKIWIKRKKIN